MTDSVQESCHNVRESVDHVVCLLGRLALAWRVLEAGLVGSEDPTPPGANCWLVRDSLKTFLSEQVSFPFPHSHTHSHAHDLIFALPIHSYSHAHNLILIQSCKHSFHMHS